jgi:hypothetical protein
MQYHTLIIPSPSLPSTFSIPAKLCIVSGFSLGPHDLFPDISNEPDKAVDAVGIDPFQGIPGYFVCGLLRVFSAATVFYQDLFKPGFASSKVIRMVQTLIYRSHKRHKTFKLLPEAYTPVTWSAFLPLQRKETLIPPGKQCFYMAPYFKFPLANGTVYTAVA